MPDLIGPLIFKNMTSHWTKSTFNDIFWHQTKKGQYAAMWLDCNTWKKAWKKGECPKIVSGLWQSDASFCLKWFCPGEKRALLVISRKLIYHLFLPHRKNKLKLNLGEIFVPKRCTNIHISIFQVISKLKYEWLQSLRI